MHLWLYARPNDIDWGEAPATEYKNRSMGTTPDLVATLQHDGGKAVVALRVNAGMGTTVRSVTAQSWMSYPHSDERHPNEFAQDYLDAKK